MDTYRAAYWSDPSYSSLDEEEICYRTTHHNRTKQCGNQEQRVLDSLTWEEILDGKGPWAQAREYCRPREELEAVKAEWRRYHGSATGTRGSPKNILGGGTQGVWLSQVGDLSQLPVLTVARGGPGRHRVMS